MPPNIINSFRIVVLTTLLLVLPLYLWRILYPITDWAILFPVILAIVLFQGVFLTSFKISRAKIEIAVRPSSPFAKWMTGRLRAIINGLTFSLIATPILAWQALAIEYLSIAFSFIVLCVACSVMFLLTYRILQTHVTDTFIRSATKTVSSIVPLFLFIPFLVYINYSIVEYSSDLQNLSFKETINYFLKKLPTRGGWIAELLTLFYAVDASKLWLVIQLGTSRWASWAGILYSIDTALVGIIVAQTSTTLTNYIFTSIQNYRNRVTKRIIRNG